MKFSKYEIVPHLPTPVSHLFTLEFYLISPLLHDILSFYFTSPPLQEFSSFCYFILSLNPYSTFGENTQLIIMNVHHIGLSLRGHQKVINPQVLTQLLLAPSKILYHPVPYCFPCNLSPIGNAFFPTPGLSQFVPASLPLGTFTIFCLSEV